MIGVDLLITDVKLAGQRPLAYPPFDQPEKVSLEMMHTSSQVYLS